MRQHEKRIVVRCLQGLLLFTSLPFGILTNARLSFNFPIFPFFFFPRNLNKSHDKSKLFHDFYFFSFHFHHVNKIGTCHEIYINIFFFFFSLTPVPIILIQTFVFNTTIRKQINDKKNIMYLSLPW